MGKSISCCLHRLSRAALQTIKYHVTWWGDAMFIKHMQVPKANYVVFPFNHRKMKQITGVRRLLNRILVSLPSFWHIHTQGSRWLHKELYVFMWTLQNFIGCVIFITCNKLWEGTVVKKDELEYLEFRWCQASSSHLFTKIHMYIL